MPKNIATTLASTLVSEGVSSLFDGGDPSFTRQIGGVGGRGLKTPGFRFNQDVVTLSPERKALTSDLSSIFSERALKLGNLLQEVRPGFGRLTKSRLQQVDDALRRVRGDLSSQLSRRKISGSSFANDVITGAESEFARIRDDIVAQSFLQELDLTVKLIKDTTDAAAASVQTLLNDQDLAVDIGLQLLTGTASAIAANNNTLAQLAIANASGAGELGARVGKAAGKDVGDILGIPKE